MLLTPVTAILTQNLHGLPINICTQNTQATTPLWHTHTPTTCHSHIPLLLSYFSPLRSWLVQSVPIPELQQCLTTCHTPSSLQPYILQQITTCFTFPATASDMSKQLIFPNLILCPRPTYPKNAATTKRIHESFVFSIKNAGQQLKLLSKTLYPKVLTASLDSGIFLMHNETALQQSLKFIWVCPCPYFQVPAKSLINNKQASRHRISFLFQQWATPEQKLPL